MAKKSYLDAFRKQIRDDENIIDELVDPTFWVGSASYALNYMTTGDINKILPQGRLLCLVGPSGSGKSFLATDIAREAQTAGYGVLYLDSEHAADLTYMEKVGVDTEAENFIYAGISKISDCINLVSKFTNGLRESGEDDKWVIVVDSLDMLTTDNNQTAFDKKGELAGDQGQHAKQIKSMLRQFVHAVKLSNTAMICTKQPYAEQDPVMKRAKPWVFTASTRFAFGTILMLTNIQLKDEVKVKGKTTKKRSDRGILLTAYSEKNRWAKPYQTIKFEIPYEEGIDKYSGLEEIGETLGLIEKSGSWKTINGRKTQNLEEQDFQFILSEMSKAKSISVELNDDEELVGSDDDS